MARVTNGRSNMANRSSGAGTANNRRIIEHGIQPAQIQIQLPIRPATAQIQPPPAPQSR